MSSRHQDWCDGHLDAPLVDTRHATRGTCKRCGYVGPLRERSGHLFPHKRFDRYAPEPVRAGKGVYRCPRCSVAAPWNDGQAVEVGDERDEFWCQTCGAEVPLEECEEVRR